MGEFSIGQAIQQFLDKSRIKNDVQAMQIQDIWAELMGKTIANYTEKIQLYNDRLFITTSVAPLKQELLYQRDKIRQRVNEALGKELVKEVIVQ